MYLYVCYKKTYSFHAIEFAMPIKNDDRLHISCHIIWHSKYYMIKLTSSVYFFFLFKSIALMYINLVFQFTWINCLSFNLYLIFVLPLYILVIKIIVCKTNTWIIMTLVNCTRNSKVILKFSDDRLFIVCVC